MSREEWQQRLLHDPAEDLFWVKEPEYSLPERARLFSSVICESCGESAPEHMMRISEGKKVCLDCFKEYSRGW